MFDFSVVDSSNFGRKAHRRAKGILRLLVKFIKHNQNYYLKLDVSTSIRGLYQKKLVLCSSGS